MKKEISSKIVAFVFLLVVSALLIFLDNFGYLNRVKNVTIYLAAPFQGIFQTSSNGITNFSKTIENIGKFKENNLKLRKENLELIAVVAKVGELKRENEILKRQLGFSENLCSDGACFNWEMGGVVGRDLSNYGEYLIINLGAKNGLKKDQAVMISGGIFVGKITEVFDNSAKVTLIISPDSSVNSLTQTTRANGVVKGKYATGANLEMIDQSEELFVGDLIITSGLESGIPKGLVIGKITSIEESANNVFKFAEVNLFADFNRIEEVFVIKNYD